MNNITAVRSQFLKSSVLLWFCISLSAATALAGESPYTPPPAHYYCMSNPDPKTEYVSALFSVPGSTSYQSISKAFTEFITGKYGKTGNIACFGDPDKTKALKQLQQMSKQASGHTVVQTGWVYKAAASSNAANSNYHGASQDLNAQPETQGTSGSGPPPAPTPNAPSAVNGVYTGTYVCAKGPTDLKLTLNSPEYGLLTGTFTFYVPPGTHNKAYTFSMNGHFDPASGKFNLNPLKWEGAVPPNYLMVRLKGAVDAKAGKVEGIVDYSGCGRFEAMKGRDD